MVEQQLVHGDQKEEILQDNKKINMKFHGIKMKGKFFAEVVDNLPSFTSRDKGRILYSNNSNIMFFGGLDAFSTEFSSLNDIPKDSIVLIDSSTAILGYSILDDVDDQLVYISVSESPYGTWTQPNHTHPFDISHIHTLNSGIHSHSFDSGSHNHSDTHSHEFNAGFGKDTAFGDIFHIGRSPDYPVGLEFQYNQLLGGGTNLNSNTTRFITQTSGIGTGNSNVDGTTQNSIASGPTISGSAQGTTGDGASANSWRPEGRNFTRQQKL